MTAEIKEPIDCSLDGRCLELKNATRPNVLLIVVDVVVCVLRNQESAKVEEKVSLRSAGKKVIAVNKLKPKPRSCNAQPVGYGRRSGYA